MSLKTALTRWMQRVWVERDRNAILELMDKDAFVSGLEDAPLYGAEAFQRFHDLLLSQLIEIEVETVRMIEEGDWVAAVFRMSATQADTGMRTTTQVHLMTRIVDGLIVEGYNLVDFFSHFEQLGVLPERTLDLCLLGQRPQFRWSEIDPRMK